MSFVRLVLLASGLAVFSPVGPTPLAAQKSPDWTECETAVAPNPSRAIAACTRVIASGLEPASRLATAFGMRAAAHQNNRDSQQAIRDYEEAARRDPTTATSMVYQASAHRIRGDHQAAIAAYDEAIRRDPKNSLAYNSRGLSYTHLGSYDRAVADFSKAVELVPNYPAAYNNRGTAYFRKGADDAAIASYDKAIALAPGYAMPHYFRGKVFTRKRDYERALADYGATIRLEPAWYEALADRCWVRAIARRELAEALADCSKALGLRPGLELAERAQALVHIRLRDWDRAIDALDRILVPEPGRPNFLYLRGLAKRGKGDASGGESDLAAALAVDPTIRETHRALGIE